MKKDENDNILEFKNKCDNDMEFEMEPEEYVLTLPEYFDFENPANMDKVSLLFNTFKVLGMCEEAAVEATSDIVDIFGGCMDMFIPEEE